MGSSRCNTGWRRKILQAFEQKDLLKCSVLFLLYCLVLNKEFGLSIQNDRAEQPIVATKVFQLDKARGLAAVATFSHLHRASIKPAPH